jgi:UDP-N-acetylglucosamine 1-carboxyvinyltransferase
MVKSVEGRIEDESHKYVVRGGNPISGTLVPGGNKNAALPMIAAALLGDEPVRLENLPQIRDVL